MKNLIIALVFSLIASSCSKSVQDPTFTTVTGVTIHLSDVTSIGLGENGFKAVAYTVTFKDNTTLFVYVNAQYSEEAIRSDFQKLNTLLHS